MTAKAQWLAYSGGFTLLGLTLLVLGIVGGDDATVWSTLGGAVFAISGGALTAYVLRTLTSDRRLPEQLRPRGEPAAPLTLVLGDGRRILAVGVVRGGYVLARRSEPTFDARQVVDVEVATAAEIEAARGPQLDKTHRALYLASIGSLCATGFGVYLAAAAANAFAWIAWGSAAATCVACLVRLTVLRARDSQD